MVRVYVETYGCSANVADAEIAMGLLRSHGHEIVEDPSSSDVNVIVTCAVKRPTADRMLYRISRLRDGGRPLIVAGCMASGETDAVERTAPMASLIHPRMITRLHTAIPRVIGGERVVMMEGDAEEKLGQPRVRRNGVISIVPVSEGCRWSRCAFCIVPRSRGSFASYSIRSIVREVEASVKAGCREVWLTSQDMGSYGMESGRNLLSELISNVTSVSGDFYVRVGMMNPIYLKPILSDLIGAYGSPKVFKFLHLPVQSGSDRVLKEMRRGHDVALFREIVSAFRSAYGGLSLTTDLIVGYPFEEEVDFESTVRLVEEIEPDFVNISRYYPRPGTPAEKLSTLDPTVVNRRSRELTEVCREIALKRNESMIGWSGTVLIDEVGSKGEAIGRNYAYRPVVLRGVDGRDYLGRLVEVLIEDARPHCLMGRLLS
ncbi:MAG: tRNA (N(6)-L-threonylcarbamoyladenosine(37)-C(2))-methylthiotransferase [Aigarchaeota archaeon]|nr:tRNA (N(6)-L-threonylcarbamoyladenosine(37)-C(2))-methylthiotransferase [Aigarchaeota archaeon]MDW8092344.1 tRNA (N(6)-L-threonylcarbamoyladenosine(37)-C(2))-methylthiotransferase [Nitrososphaerota archaeon]